MQGLVTPWFTCRGAMGMPLGQAKLQEEWTWLSAHLGSRTTSEPLLHASPDNPRQGPGDHAAKWPSERAHTRMNREKEQEMLTLLQSKATAYSAIMHLDRGQILG